MTRKNRVIVPLAASLFLCLVSSPAQGATTPEQDRSPDALQARLDEAEKNYKIGKVDVAIEQANSLIDLEDSSFLKSDKVAQDAKADLALFQLKSGKPDQTAMLIRELLLSLQLDLPMDPRYATNSAEVLAESPQILKDYFGKLLKRFDEKVETKQIIDSLIDNTVPKDYKAQLKTYCQRIETSSNQLSTFQSVADSEELKYGDPLSSLEESDSGSVSDPKIDSARLEQLNKSLDELATQAQQMPVGDMRASLGIYRLALLANSAKFYKQAETFALQSLAHANAITNRPPNVPQVKIALAYALLKQGKTADFNTLKGELLKNYGDQERLLVTLARFTEVNGDNAGAASIYKQALDNRTKLGNSQSPEWMDSYNEVLKKL